MRKVLLIEANPEVDSRLTSWDAAEDVAKSIAKEAPGDGDVIVRWASRTEIDAVPFGDLCPLLIVFDVPTTDPANPRHYQVIAAHVAKDLDTHGKGYEWKFDNRAGTVTRVLPLPSAEADATSEGDQAASAPPAKQARSRR
jgi:hypothetical protein